MLVRARDKHFPWQIKGCHSNNQCIDSTLTCDEASLGKPLTSIPTSVLVPPMSTTIPSFFPDKNMAPLILLVGPEEKVNTGYSTASTTLKKTYS